jgi:predicted AAA+ superfamily ATPase
MTDLIRGAGKFRKSAIRPRAGFQKFYPVDLALRNAVLRLGGEILDDPSVMGLYAETLVYNALRKWPGVLQVDYYRESQLEVDFIVHTRPMQYLPVEVKYSATVGAGDLKGLTRFRAKYRCTRPMLVTREREDFGLDKELGVFKLPLILFLLLFD